MAHGEHELNEWMKIYEEDYLLNKYLGGGSRDFFKNEQFQINRDEKITSATIQDLQEDIQEIENKPTTRELDDEKALNRTSAHVALGLGIGATVGVTLATNGIVSATPAITFGTSIFTGLLGYLNNKCYQKKPLSNAISNHILNKKRHQLDESEKELSQIKHIQEMLDKQKADKAPNKTISPILTYVENKELENKFVEEYCNKPAEKLVMSELEKQLGKDCIDSINMYRDDIGLEDTIEK